LRDQEKLRNQREADAYFCVVLMSDGVDTMHNEPQATAVLDRLNKMITGADLKILFRALNIGKSAVRRTKVKQTTTIE
jgi:hypothetical protein